MWLSVNGLDQVQKDHEKEAGHGKKGKRKRIIALILLLSISLIGVLVFAPQGNDEKPVGEIDPPKIEDRGFGEDGELDMTNAETIRYGLQDKVDNSMVNYRINTNPKYNDGKVNWMIENKANNKGLLQVDIILDGEVIYKSPTLKPNQKDQNGKADLSYLAEGDYEAVAVFNVYDPKTKYKVGSPAVKINLTINGGKGI